MDTIAILDFGGQYAHLIANRVRRLGVYSEILDPRTPLPKLGTYKGLILSGGPQSVYGKGAPSVNAKIFQLGVPILGICYGHQLIAHILDGKVKPGKIKEYGFAKLRVKKSKGIFRGFSHKGSSAAKTVWMSHGDSVSKLPEGFEVFGSTSDCPFAAYGDLQRNIYGAQFHVEVTHTQGGMKMLSNFLDLCGAKREWDMSKFLEMELYEIKKRLGKDKKVFLLVSGGVDSTVAFALLNKALGSSRIYGLFVDTGFLRKNEGQKVDGALRALGFRNFHKVEASGKFFKALEGATDPEKKRNIIGNTFLEVQKQEIKKLKLNTRRWLLGQGTIYPDTIETGGTKHAAKIKTHHNRVPEIEALIKKGLVIEPLKNLYKDEVREVGAKLGLPSDIVWRHPFPGPGLAVRLLCAKKSSFVKNQKYQKSFEKTCEKFCKKQGLKDASCRMLPLQSVGVQGDDRTYRHPLLISGKKGFGHKWDKYEALSTSLTNRFQEINRVLLALFPDTVSGVTFHAAYLSKKRVSLLQKVDDIVMRFIKRHRLDREIWQFPVVLLPVTTHPAKNRHAERNFLRGETILLRPVVSKEAMTANFHRMDWKLLWHLMELLRKISGVSGVLYDITNKPPGTIEWE